MKSLILITLLSCLHRINIIKKLAMNLLNFHKKCIMFAQCFLCCWKHIKDDCRKNIILDM